VNNFTNQNDIIEAILNGMEKARKNFLHWTNDRLFLSYAPEKMLSIHIAQEIANIKNPPEIFIDATVSDILRCSLKDRKAFLNYMHKNGIKEGVFDITLDERFEHKNNNDSISRVIISVKNGIRSIKEEQLNEIERICKMLDPKNTENSSLDYGVFAFYTDLPFDARKKLDKRIPLFIKSFNAIVEKFPNLKAQYKDRGIKQLDGVGEWVLSTYTITKTRS